MNARRAVANIEVSLSTQYDGDTRKTKCFSTSGISQRMFPKVADYGIR